MAYKYRHRKLKKTEFHSPEVVRRNELLQYPRDLRGPTNNDHGGHQATRLRGYRTKGVTSGPCKSYTEEERRRFAEEYARRAASA